MNDLILHGLRELYGNDVVDYPGCWYLYSDEVKKRNFDTNKLWGKGFNLNNSLHEYDLIDREDISTKIKSKYFDLIVYGSIRRSSHFLDEVIKSNNKYIFIDGEDDRVIDNNCANKSLYFKRELLKETSNIKPINFSIPNVDAEAFMLTTKDLISVSNGSACTSSSYEPSHVIKAMTNDQNKLKGAIRISWCHLTKEKIPIAEIKKRLENIV